MTCAGLPGQVASTGGVAELIVKERRGEQAVASPDWAEIWPSTICSVVRGNVKPSK